jgi:hypothetical protein
MIASVAGERFYDMAEHVPQTLPTLPIFLLIKSSYFKECKPFIQRKETSSFDPPISSFHRLWRTPNKICCIFFNYLLFYLSVTFLSVFHVKPTYGQISMSISEPRPV